MHMKKETKKPARTRIVKHNQIDIDDTSGNKNSHKQQCEQNHNDNEQEDEIDTTSFNNNNNEKQQKSTHSNKIKQNLIELFWYIA